MEINKKMLSKIIYLSIGLILLLVSQISFAAIVIGPNTIITSPTTYSNDTLDLTNGNFIILNNATLTIKNCTVLGTLSPFNPTLITVASGTLDMDGNTVKITTSGILPHPYTQSLQYVIRLEQAKLSLTGNTFEVDQQFRVGLLITSITTATSDFQIAHNSFQNFHGVLYLINSAHDVIDGNIFKLNSYGNMVIIGSDCQIINNSMYFSGLNFLGNAIDILNSDTVLVKNNVLFTSTCHGIYLLLSNNVTIDSNTITGGITYAMHLLSSVDMLDKHNYALKLVKSLGKFKFKHQRSTNLTVTNNMMSQNRFGITTFGVDNLTITDNFFSQRFNDAASRKFWTDNSILLRDVTGLTWLNNTYKEAFTQVNAGDNSNTQFVTFPATGGVVL